MLVLNSPDGQLPPVMKEEYLRLIASWLLEEALTTEDDLYRDTDNAYTRGSTRFGRQRQRILNEYLSGRHPWFKVMNGGQDIVFSIHDIPCRFSNDDPDAPKKRAVLETHVYQMQLLEAASAGEPARFVFVIDRGPNESADPRVVLLGFSNSDEVVCRWFSSTGVRAIGVATPSLPQPIELPKPQVAIKQRRTDAGDDIASAGP